MNTSFYKLNNSISNIPLKLIKKLANNASIFPLYHTISNKPLVHIKNLYQVRNTASFEKDLDFFLKHYTPIQLDLLFQHPEKIKKNHFLITFDDGLSEFHDVISPILLRKGIPAVCFLNSDFIDNKDLFYRYKVSILIETLKNGNFDTTKIKKWFTENNLIINTDYSDLLKIKYPQKAILDDLAALLNISFSSYLENEKPYMSTKQINDLITKGFSFGSHSIDHPLYSELNIENQLNQTFESTKIITKQFNLDYKLFAFPFTDTGVSKKYFDTIYNNENQNIDFSFGTAGLKNDYSKNNIQRVPIEVDSFSAEEIVKGEYMYYFVKAFLNKNFIKRI